MRLDAMFAALRRLKSLNIARSTLGVRAWILACAVGSWAGPAVAQTPSAGAPSQVPTILLAKGTPVSIDAADRILRARVSGPQPPTALPQPLITAPVRRPAARKIAAALAAPTCPAQSQQPVEIVTLAAALKCDPDLIFEYVYNNIEYEPLFGSNKGALGTLLDQRGSDIDQAQLFTALLSAAGFSASQLNYQYGYVRLTGTQAPPWLGVKNDAVAILNLIANGGIPINYPVVEFPDGTLDYIDVAHVWVQVQINGTWYVFDPSFKLHTISTRLSNLGTALGYTQNQFLSDAGGTIDSVSIRNINRSNLRNDLTGYANNLVNYILANNPAWTLNDVVGGKTIQYLTGSPLRQTSLPYLSPSQPSGFPQNWGSTVPNAYRTCFTLSMPGVTPTQCFQASSQTIQLFSDQTYGYRITVFSSPDPHTQGNFIPTLLINGAPPPNGQNTGTSSPPSTKWNVSVCILHPYVSPDVNVCDTANPAKQLTITPGGSYLIGAGWGQVGRGMIQKHRTLLEQARAAGNGPSSEIVLGETLAVINYTWLAEVAAEARLGDAIGQLTSQYHHGVGITAEAQIQNTSSAGPYVDLPLNAFSIQPQTNYTGSGFAPNLLSQFFSLSGASSSLELAVLEQTQALTAGMQAASTVRLIDINATTGAKTFFADGTTSTGVSAYFNSILPNLSGYTSGDLSSIACAISTTCTSSGSPTGKQVLLPSNGNISVGLWQGSGYTVIDQINPSGSTPGSISILNKITGGLSGGFSGDPIDTADLVQSTLNMYNAIAGYEDMTLATASVFMAAPYVPTDQTISEPVDGVTGTYVYQHTDMITGGGNFPYALPFARTYMSSSNMTDVGLGNGWTGSYSISVNRSSNPMVGLGAVSPISAAEAIAAVYVAQDLLSNGTIGVPDTTIVQHMTVSWLLTRWLTDQLTNNSLVVSWPNNTEEFIWLPHTDGSATVGYNEPNGSTAVLTGSVPDQYGYSTVFTYQTKDNSLLTFNALSPTTLTGQIASWQFANGMSVAFAYNSASNLTQVSNNLGRSLALGYTGTHVSSVTDAAGRSIAFTYDGNDNLTSFTDPLQNYTAYAYDGAASHLIEIFYPSVPALPFVTNSYDALGHVIQQANADGELSTFYMAGSRTEFADALGNRHVTYQTPTGKVFKDDWVLSASFGDVFNDTAQQNGIVNVTSNFYDGLDRLALTELPEQGLTLYEYAGAANPWANNIASIIRFAKPGSPLSPLTTSFSYHPIYNKPIQVTDPLGLVSTLSYDGSTGNLLSAVADTGTSPHFNATSRFSYDGFGRVLTATDPNGVLNTFSYDSFENLISQVADAGGSGHLNATTGFGYDNLGNVVSRTDPNGNTAAMSYDADRRLVTTTAPAPFNGSAALVQTTNAYDADGHLLSVTRANGASNAVTSLSYTATGQVQSVTDPNGNVTTNAYDADDRLASVTDPLYRITNYGYDAMSRRISVGNPAIQAGPLLQQSYTPDGLIASLTDANNNTTTFSPDGLDRLATTTYPGGSTETLSYDADGNVLTRKTRKGDTITFSYDTLNRLAAKAAPSEPTVSYAYDLASHLIGVSDNSAALAAPSASASYTASYAYDQINRPLTVNWSPAPVQTTPTAVSASFMFGYDATNRRIGQSATDNSWWSYPATATNVSYTANALNQYSAVGSVTPSYDGNGNLTYDGTLTYGYDAENRLVSATGTGLTASYAYDAQSHRKSKTVNGTITIYVTDANNREVLEYNGSSGAIQNWYAYALGPNAVLNQMNVTAGTRATLIPDIQGSFVGALDASSGTLTKFGYQAYGESNSTGGSFRYTGQRIDPETGLYYYRSRMYSPAFGGRFMQPDPIRYAGGINLYAYVGNDPLNGVDAAGTIGGYDDLVVSGTGFVIGIISQGSLRCSAPTIQRNTFLFCNWYRQRSWSGDNV